jgi:hypothetical protein
MGALETPLAYFVDVSASVGLDRALGMRLSVADVNNDGYPDIFSGHHVDAGFVQQHLYLSKWDTQSQRRVFEEAPNAAGLRLDYAGNVGRDSEGAIFGDVDNDGDLDAFVFAFTKMPGPDYDGMDQTERRNRTDLYINRLIPDGSLAFQPATAEPFLDEYTDSRSNARTGKLYLGRFMRAATFLDYDLDGKLDIYSAVAPGRINPVTSMPADQIYRNTGGPSPYYQNYTSLIDGPGKGTDKLAVYSTSGGYTNSFLFGVTSADWNGDRYPDVFTGAYGRYSISRLWQNSSGQGFVDVKDRGYATEENTFMDPDPAKDGHDWQYVSHTGAYPRDFDNDDDLDLLNTSIHGKEGTRAVDGGTWPHSCIQVNGGPASGFSYSYALISNAERDRDDPYMGHHRDTYGAWVDINNDGWADVVIGDKDNRTNTRYNLPPHGTYSQLLIFAHRRSGGQSSFHSVANDIGFYDLNKDVNPDNPAYSVYGHDFHNVIPFDYDLDGDEDLLVGYTVNAFSLWENRSVNSNKWIKVRAVGGGGVGQSNKQAVGAQVKIWTTDGIHMQEVSAGDGHAGPQLPARLHFGVGTAASVQRVLSNYSK